MTKPLAILAAILLSVFGLSAHAATDWNTQEYDLYPGDFNGDGKTDLLYVAKDPGKPNGIALSDGNGLNIPLQSWPSNYLGIAWSNSTYRAIVADFNGDGRSDVFMQRNSPGDHYVILANTEGKLVGINQTIGDGGIWSYDQHTIVAGDISGDGRADLFLQAAKPGPLNYFVPAGEGGVFGFASQQWSDNNFLGLKWSRQDAFVYVGDFNGDGKKDLLLQARPKFIQIDYEVAIPIPTYPPNLNAVVLSQGGASPIQLAGVKAFSRNQFGADFSPLTSNIVVGDFNGDGRADIVLQGRYSGRTSYLLNGNASGAAFSTATALANNVSLSADGVRLVAGNFDGTGGVGLYLQTTNPAGGNAVANTITGGSIGVSGHDPASATGIVPASAAGVTPGSFSIGNDGTANYSIPIVVPPGVGGVQPGLALTYSSRRGNGWLGIGWDISGLSQIARCNKNFAQDGIAEAVSLSMSDRFCLDGARLRSTGGTYGAAGSTYQLELETFARITAYGIAGNGPAYFVLEAKNGFKYEYGSTGDSRIESLSATAAGTPRAWALNKVTDRSGNIMTVSYMEDTINGSFHPVEMTYTSNAGANVSAAYKVKFVWESRPAADSLTGYFAGGLIKEVYRLNRIETQFNDPSAGGFRLVRKYQLSYALNGTTSRSRLVAVQECEYSGTCLSPTNIGWQEGQSGLSSAVALPLPASAPVQPVTLLDINGDGRTDLLQREEGAGTIKFRLANASGGFDAPQDTGLTYFPSLPLDYNGDGKDDVAAYNNSQTPQTYFILQSTGAGFTTIPVSRLVNGLTDVNGDGRLDMFVPLAGNPGALAVSFNGPSGFGSPVQVFPPSVANLASGDFNGDGRTDVFVRNVTFSGSLVQYSGDLRLLLSQGMSYVETGVTLSPDSPLLVADLNGDGIDDITYICGSSRCIRFGGAGGPTAGLGSEKDTGQPAMASTNSNGLSIFLIDWDSDGKTDLLQGMADNNYQLIRSTGESFAAPVDTGIPRGSAPQFSFLYVSQGDTNGDGLTDVSFYRTLINNGITTTAEVRTHRPGVADLVTSVADGFGNTTNVTYAPLTDAAVYAKGSGATLPLADVIKPMQVVKQYSQTDGTGGSYTVSANYRGARVDKSGRGFLGFASRRLVDSRDNIKVYDYYRQDFPFIGKVSQHDELQPDNATLISRSTNTYTSTALDATANNQRYLVVPTQTTVKSYEVGGTKNGVQIAEEATSAVFDNFGNLTDITRNTTDKDPSSPFFNQVWQAHTVNVFSSDAVTFRCALPTQSAVTNTLPDGSAQTRRVDFTIDLAQCRPTQQVVEPSSSTLKVTSNLGYDSCGNLNSIGVIGKKPDGSDMSTRTGSFNFGSRCVFPETSTNALGQVTTASFRYDIGALSSVTDPNGRTASVTYDNFGRLLRQTRVDGTATDRYYLSCTNANSYCNVPDLRYQVQSVERDTANGTISTAVTFFDGLGRARISQAQRATGAPSYSSTTYDSLGRQVTRSQPYSGSSNGFFRNTYDLLNRLTRVDLVRPDSSVYRTSTISYAGGTTTSTDPKFHTRETVFDSAGALRKVTDASGTTQYSYDPFLNLKSVTDPLGNMTTAGFNTRGFRTSFSDPDQGSSTFTFDSLGELLSKTDAKNQTVSFTYDKLGRVQTRVEPEGTTTFVFDTAAHGIGQLASVTSPGSPSNYMETYLYDSAGRTQQVTFTEDTTYQVNYDYNNQGLLDAVTYPTSTSGYRLKLKYAYAYGFLVQLKDYNAPTTVFWSLNATDDANNPTDETLGNDGTFGGVKQSSTYNQLTGELISRQSGTGGSTSNLQNLAYQWDLTGNLLQRQDSLQTKTEVFSYDSLDRLTGSTLNGTSNLNVGFNALGNITSKSDVGTYNYTTAQTGCTYYSHTQPHAVRAAGSNIYCYDANGNMTKRAGSTISYTSYDLPSQINQGSNSSQFYYNAFRARWKQVATYGGSTETTIYVGGLIDKVTRGGVTEYRHYIATGSDASAIHTRRSDGTSQTYYVNSDHLGSTSVITDHTGAVKVRESFTAFGARRGNDWSGAPDVTDLNQIAATTRDGYTGHEHLDNVGLIHMNGRVYDPTLGRFTSADPFVQDPTDSQSFNRYSYVFNSPLSYTDPSGFIVANPGRSPDVSPDQPAPVYDGGGYADVPGGVGLAGFFGIIRIPDIKIAIATNPVKGNDGFMTGTGTGNDFVAIEPIAVLAGLDPQAIIIFGIPIKRPKLSVIGGILGCAAGGVGGAAVLGGGQAAGGAVLCSPSGPGAAVCAVVGATKGAIEGAVIGCAIGGPVGYGAGELGDAAIDRAFNEESKADGVPEGPFEQDEVGKIKNAEDVGPIGDKELEPAQQQLEQSIRQRKREQSRFPRGSPNGNRTERFNDGQYKDHRDRIKIEEKILEDVNRRIDGIRRTPK